MELLPLTAALATGLLAGAALGGAFAYLLAERKARTAEADLKSQLAASAAQLAASQSNTTAQAQLLDEANIKLTAAFAAVSQDALAKANLAFLQMAEAKFQTLSTEAAGSLDTRKAQIETLLKPLTELLAAYQLRLAEVEKNRADSYSALQKQMGTIAEIERTLSQQTTQLVTALTRPNVRGQWGEITLRKLVELAGMSAHCDFEEQTSITSTDAAGGGGRLRPDMIVQLPDNRSIVIDAKAVLAAFLDAASAPDEPTRQAHLQRHSRLIRDRAKDLSSKAYWSQFPNTPEFVVLFLPGESFLYAAVERDPALIEDCLKDRVILATPTTLIALLKTIEFGWRQEAISRNAEEIRRLGAEIYDRLAVLANHMEKVGHGLDSVVKSYNDAVSSLETRLLVSARKMGELGISHAKEIPETLPRIDRTPQQLSATLKPDQSPLLP